MIIFLTLIYVGALALAVKIGLIRLSLFWKFSPILWMLLLFVALFLPMQWGAPTGTVNIYQYVIEIVPNVSGQVIDVPVRPMTKLERGSVLFQIDPIPYQAKVDQLEAQLAATVQNVGQLQAAAEASALTVARTLDDIEIQKESVAAAKAKVMVTESVRQQTEASLTKATDLVADLQLQVDLAEREYKRQKTLLDNGAGSKSETDAAELRSANLASQWHAAKTDLLSAEQAVTGSIASLSADQANLRRSELQLEQMIKADLPRTKAVARESQIAANSMIGDEHTSVAGVRAQLEAAQFDLEQTTVRAPSDGKVAFVSLRPGQRVANLPLRSWMAFIDTEKTEVVALVQQYALRNVAPGQSAEITLKLRPGKVYPATVDRIINVTASGQLQPSGQLISTSTLNARPEPFAVVLKLDEEFLDEALISGGAKGTAAIYTDSMQATHVIRRIMMRMDAWLNYLLP